MTQPKQILPGQFVEICRRTTQRTFFWRPGADSRELFGYMFGKAVNDHDQTAHAAAVLSNHAHIGVTDNQGKRSGFMQQLFSNTARKRNLQLKRQENLWSSGAPGDMAVLDIPKLIERLLYIFLQPVAAGLVERVGDWTGFMILPRHWGKKMTFHRPALCGESMPETVEFTPMPPPGFDHLPLEDVIAFFEDLIEQEERRYARLRKGRPVIGIAVCEAMSPFHQPKTDSPIGTLNPRFTTSDPILLIRALESLRRFKGEHRRCRIAFLSGKRDVVFPEGTFQMVHSCGVACTPCSPNHPMLLDTTWTPAVQAMWDDWIGSCAA
jgi:hypothetical protein